MAEAVHSTKPPCEIIDFTARRAPALQSSLAALKAEREAATAAVHAAGELFLAAHAPYRDWECWLGCEVCDEDWKLIQQLLRQMTSAPLDAPTALDEAVDAYTRRREWERTHRARSEAAKRGAETRRRNATAASVDGEGR